MGETFSLALEHGTWRVDGSHVEASVNSVHGVSSLQVVTQARACVVVSSPSPEVFEQKLESPGQNSG